MPDTAMTPLPEMELGHELAALRSQMGTLADHLVEAARCLREPGAPPPDALIDDLTAASLRFIDVRAAALALARDLSGRPVDVTGASLQELEGLLAHCAWERAHSARRRDLEKAGEIAARVARLRHCEEDEFLPLASCKQRAHAVLAEIDDVANDPTADTQRITDACTAFEHLLLLV